MGIFTSFLAASDANKMLTTEEVEAFVTDLLCEQMVKLPGALLVGEARSMAPLHWEEHAEYESHRNLFIVPNALKLCSIMRNKTIRQTSFGITAVINRHFLLC